MFNNVITMAYAIWMKQRCDDDLFLVTKQKSALQLNQRDQNIYKTRRQTETEWFELNTKFDAIYNFQFYFQSIPIIKAEKRSNMSNQVTCWTKTEHKHKEKKNKEKPIRWRFYIFFLCKHTARIFALYFIRTINSTWLWNIFQKIGVQ